jgi:hypothetical protein
MCRILFYPLTHDDFHRDMPPAGGFEAVRYKRNLPLRGPSGLAILGGVTVLCAYGFYRVGMGNIEKRCVLFRGSVNVRTDPGGGRKTCQVICRAQRGTWRYMGSGRVTQAYHVEGSGRGLWRPKSGKMTD